MFIIQSPAARGVNIVKIIIVNCLTINFIFSFTNRYINIAITSAVVIAFPVLILVSILFPSRPSREPFANVTNKCTKLLLMNSKNLINKGAKAIATPPKHNLVRLSFASFFLAVFIPATIIL